MKIVLWISFYVISFLALIVGMYFARDAVSEKTRNVPVLNYTQYHHDAEVADSSYTEKIDSLAVVVEGLLGEMVEYVTQLQDRDFKLSTQNYEIDKLKMEKEELKKIIEGNEEKKINYNHTQEEQRLQDLAKMLGSMKPDVLSPILASLPDNLVKIFYYKAKAKDRAKIFNALPADRAGKILTDIADTTKGE